MKTIGMNHIVFASAVLQAGNAAASLDSAQDEWVSMGEKSIALEAFADEFLQLEGILKTYGELVQKNVNTIRDVGLEMTNMDQKIQGVWNLMKGE